jgi:hypothetical protein
MNTIKESTKHIRQYSIYASRISLMTSAICEIVKSLKKKI